MSDDVSVMKNEGVFSGDGVQEKTLAGSAAAAHGHHHHVHASPPEAGENGERKAHHTDKMKENLITRMKRIEGQIRGIARMIDEDTYCDDVLNQISSVEAALNGVRKLLLEAHIRSCIVEQIQSGELEVIDELMKTIGKMTR